MTLAAYLAGAALLAVTLAGAATSSVLLVRRRLDHLAGSPRVVALALLGATAVFLVHVIPLATGTLTRLTPPLLSVLLAAALWRLLPGAPTSTRAESGRAAAPAAVAVAAGPRPAASRASWGLALAAAGATAVAGAGEIRSYSLRAFRIVDTVSFHVPNVTRWIQSGSLWHIAQFLPYLWQGDYPNTGDVFSLALVLPWHRDFADRFLDPAFLVLLVVAVYALAVEIGASRPAALIFGCAVAVLPTITSTAYVAEMPDPVMYATFACGLLFLARFVRTRLRSDLVLAGVGLGLCLGVKWYSLTSVFVVLIAWGGGEVLAHARVALRARRARTVDEAPVDEAPAAGWSTLAPRRFARVALGLVGLIVLLGGIWFVRNWVESDDPFFPTPVHLLGIHLFSAPADYYRPLAGFTIFDYLHGGDGHIWRTYLLPSFHTAFADIGWVLLGGTLIALLLMVVRKAHREAGWRALALAAIAFGCTVAYFATPYSAFGPKGYPAGTYINARYWVPALIAAAPVCAWAAGRLGDLGGLVELAGAFAVFSGLVKGFTAASGYDLLVGAGVLVLLVLAVTATVSRRAGPRPRLAVAGLLAAGLLLAGHHVERVFLAGRYAKIDPALASLARDTQPQRVALAGIWNDDGIAPILPSFGPDLANDVQYVGPWINHELVQYRHEAPFVAALRRGDFDEVILGRSSLPHQPVTPAAWILAAGYRVSVVSARFVLFTRAHP